MQARYNRELATAPQGFVIKSPSVRDTDRKQSS